MRFAAAFLIVFVVASVTLTAQAWFEDKSLRDLAHLVSSCFGGKHGWMHKGNMMAEHIGYRSQ